MFPLKEMYTCAFVIRNQRVEFCYVKPDVLQTQGVRIFLAIKTAIKRGS